MATTQPQPRPAPSLIDKMGPPPHELEIVAAMRHVLTGERETKMSVELGNVRLSLLAFGKITQDDYDTVAQYLDLAKKALANRIGTDSVLAHTSDTASI
jgi:hypothetical protein